MEIKLQKWGNSYGIRIPMPLLKTLNIKENDRIKIEQEDEKIVISKVNKKKISLKERIENYKGKESVEEFDWGKPVGREIW